MIFPRIGAAIFVVLLIGSFALAGVGGVAWLGPLLAHGNDVEHASGTIIAVGPGRNVLLRTSTGQELLFQCGEQCRASLGHLQRHLREHANTDVYYKRGPDNALLAVDID